MSSYVWFCQKEKDRFYLRFTEGRLLVNATLMRQKAPALGHTAKLTLVGMQEVAPVPQLLGDNGPRTSESCLLTLAVLPGKFIHFKVVPCKTKNLSLTLYHVFYSTGLRARKKFLNYRVDFRFFHYSFFLIYIASTEICLERNGQLEYHFTTFYFLI